MTSVYSWPCLLSAASPAAPPASAPAAPLPVPAGATTAVTDAALLRGHLSQLSPPFARAAILASSLGNDPKLYRPTPARATSATWSMVRSASLPNLDDINSSESEQETVREEALQSVQSADDSFAPCLEASVVEKGACESARYLHLY